MRQDLMFALRSLMRARGFTLAAVATLALGIAANAIVFGLVDSLLLRPLPFGERSPRLVSIHSTHPTQARDWDDSEISYPDLLDYRENVRSLEAVEGYMHRNVSLTGVDETERVLSASVTPGMFRLLGVSPMRGRDFQPRDGAAPGFEQVMVISHALWHRRFQGDPAIVGRGVPMNGRALTVVGVMPPGFGFPERHDLWLPYAADPQENRDGRVLLGIGLLKPGVSLQQARAEMSTAAANLAQRYPDSNRGWGVYMMPIRDFYVRPGTRRAVSAMLGAVALVLLVACANVAGLILARGIGRQRELALRAALGAGRRRLIRLMLAESVLLAVAGAIPGVLLAQWGLRASLASSPEPPPYWVTAAIDSRVLIFVVVVTVFTALACGLLPALRVSRVGPAARLQSDRSGGASAGQRRLQKILVVAQLSVSLALLVAAVLLAQSAMRLQHADGGFDPAPLLSLRFYIAGDAYDPPEARAQVVSRIVNRIAEFPGVQAVAATSSIPTDDGGQAIQLAPPGGSRVPDDAIGAHSIAVTPAFWQTLGLSLEGRTFSEDENLRPLSNVVIVNRRLASRYWPGESAIGREIQILESTGPRSFRVIGVAPDLVYEELGEETEQSRLSVYRPYATRGFRTMALLIRAAGDPGAVAPPVRTAIREIDPAFATFDVMTMPARRRFTHWTEGFLGRVFGGFAIAALLLASLGAYGLAAYSAAQRKREVGVRVALGAKRIDVLRLLVTSGLRLGILGVLVGVPIAIAAARVVQGLLFDVSPWQAVLWLGAPFTLLIVVFLASYIPARRASLMDPATALHHD